MINPAAPAVYSGPARVALYDGAGTPALLGSMQADGEAGDVTLALENKVNPRFSALDGYMGSTAEDSVAKIGVKPFDSWALLGMLFPFKCVLTGGTIAGGLDIGMRPHDVQSGVANGLGNTKIWTPQGTLYRVVRTAITKHPTLELGVSKPLFSGIEITGLADPAKNLGDVGAVIYQSAITETGATDPDPTGFNKDFLNGQWTGSFAASGWGGNDTDAVLQGEDGFQLACNAKYGVVQISKRTYHMHLQSVQFMVKAKLVGPTHSTILAKLLSRSQGIEIGEATPTDLVLTGPQGKTITLKNCAAVGENTQFTFGGNKLNAGEVAFITKTSYTAGVKNPVIIFSE